MRPFKLSVDQYRKAIAERELREFGYVNQEDLERRVKQYAIDRQKYKRRVFGESNQIVNISNCEGCNKNNQKNPDLKYNMEVLERMKISGCSPCEIKAQEKWIQKLKEKQSGS